MYTDGVIELGNYLIYYTIVDNSNALFGSLTLVI